MFHQKPLACFFLGMIASSASISAADKLKALIVDGQNNHLVWPKSTVMMKQYLEESVHAADNTWPEWKEFNRMIGLGGWGGRNEKDGPYVYYNDQDVIVPRSLQLTNL